MGAGKEAGPAVAGRLQQEEGEISGKEMTVAGKELREIWKEEQDKSCRQLGILHQQERERRREA